MAGRWISLESVIVLVSGLAPTTAFMISIRSFSIRNSYMAAGAFALFYPVRFYRLRYPIGRVLAPGTANIVHLTALQRQAIGLVCDLLVLILTAASVIHSGLHWYATAYHVSLDEFNFYDSFYFAALGTLHNTDSIPQNWFSHLVTLCMVCFIALLVPSRATRLVELVLHTSRYTKKPRLTPQAKHIIVCGHLDHTSVNEFLSEFFAQDHGPGVWDSTVIILHPSEPSSGIKEILANPAFINRVTYVRGDPTQLEDLKKAHGYKATSIFIMSPKHSYSEIREDDAGTITAALALSKFAKHYFWQDAHDCSNYQIFAQVLLPESVEQMNFLGIPSTMCIEEYRMGIMAQSCAIPGFAALIYMLSMTVTDQEASALLGSLSQQQRYAANSSSWAKEYLDGVCQEIYEVPIPQGLIGRSFFKVARHLYRAYKLVLFGVGSPLKDYHMRSCQGGGVACDGMRYDIRLCPHSHTFKGGDIMFIIAPDTSAIQKAFDGANFLQTKKPTKVFADSSYPSSKDNTCQIDGKVTVEDVDDGAWLSENVYGESYISEGDDSSASESGPELESPRNANVHRDGSTATPATPGVKRSVDRRLERVGRIFDNIPQDLHGHIVVCDASPRFPRNLPLLIQSLKVAYEDDLLPVVILCPSIPDKPKLRILRDFANVFIIRGTPLSKPDLRRALIAVATKAIILANNKYYFSKKRNANMVDSTTLLSAMNIKSIRGDSCFTVAEILSPESIQHLDQSQFIGTKVWTESDSGPNSQGGSLDLDNYQRGSKNGKLRLLYIPPPFIGLLYSDLVLILMKRHCSIPLGLLRPIFQSSRKFPCVICNPHHKTTIKEGDAVYILGPPIPAWQTVKNSYGTGETIDFSHSFEMDPAPRGVSFTRPIFIRAEETNKSYLDERDIETFKVLPFDPAIEDEY
ncbi:hypothetical protein H4219_004379 [Mycoemilia scoparia]|uniref:Calcium-activated potassium channel BK alpha subunit domain-containing protein n=1 Tax=Mycoemilia scoparia TaxID=417184 RepID=A0A9W8DRG9_9FUNG|nr:hypothetical protein H4219_004379 [Mycoemilia scoparia]